MFLQNKTKTEQLINAVVSAAAVDANAQQQALVQDFIRRYYARVPHDDLVAHQLLDLYGAAVSHMQFGLQRQPGTTRVRVYNPSFDKHGWRTTHTILEIVTDDKPFLVDSVAMALNQRSITTHLTVHPIIRVQRDADGRLQQVLPQHEVAGQNESFMQFHLDKQTDEVVLKSLEADIQQVLEDSRLASEDWQAMRKATLQVVTDLQANHAQRPADIVQEAAAFCSWLEAGHLTYLGYCEYQILEGDSLQLIAGTELGVLKDQQRKQALNAGEFIPMSTASYFATEDVLFVAKANLRSTVHRPGYMDFIGIKRYAEDGSLCGLVGIFGLFTSSAYRRATRDIPLLRHKVGQVIKSSGLIPVSHEGKVLEDILESYPRDELFQSSAEQLLAIGMGILELQERQRLRLFVRADNFQRYYACLVYVPREKYSRELRLTIQDILVDALGGGSVDFDTLFSSESVLARIYYTIHTLPGAEPKTSFEEIEQRLIEAARSWQDKLRAALIEQDGEELGTERFHAYAEAFPAAYRDTFSARAAALDIQRIEAVQTSGLGMQFYRPITSAEGLVHFKLYTLGSNITLSDVIPVIENMGMRVEGENPYEIERADGRSIHIHEFTLTHKQNKPVDVEAVAENFQTTFAHVWLGHAENDGFNQLVVNAGLGWRDVVVLRAYCKYLLQIRIPFSQEYMIESLLSNAPIAAKLAALFQSRFEPKKRRTDAEQAKIIAGILTDLDAVAVLDQDRILRAYLGVIQASLRTNFYQSDADGKPKTYLSIKFDPSAISDMPLPRPKYEIFVYSPRIEGVHLRGGKVARGGLRWSDRREDFRTEVLGLMKAQMVKNAVIVPVGSKGGFFCKRLPEGDRDIVMTEVVTCYKTFISGLLDLTDNLAAGAVVPPPQVQRYDEDDPYLVVAADKGTATFSDIANSVSADYGFWLGDAFASGGSAGYDHKKMGITARGAWESVKRHFRQLGKNIQAEDFTVIGIGDMAGDVFGNGMLLSPHIRLLAAFNHAHIFLDPTPNAASSFKERQRLFNLPRSSWMDYDKKLISEGGGIYPRSAKSIAISEQVKQALGISETHLTPTELIRHLLIAKVDLLWNGGIGTYVKATSETHAQVSDKANDALRVDGKELRCRVVGEGGNLGFTQLGRIEYARAGGHLYTDAIDNSAGVDCSDHEVNIKILLNAMVAEGDMTLKQRNQLLADMTDEVAELVLKDNYGQTEAISMALAEAPANLNEHGRFIRLLEQSGSLKRALEYLPSDEILAERAANQQGLTSPELSVLLAYSKMRLYEALLVSDVAEDEYLSTELNRYFPDRLAKDYQQAVMGHRLKREIIATHITNSLVTRLGPTYVMRVQDETGASAAEIARAYTAARNIFGIRDSWYQIEALDNQVSAQTQVDLLVVLRGLLERAILWLLRNRHAPINIANEVAYFYDGAQALMQSLPQRLDAHSRLAHKHLSKQFTSAGVPAELAGRIAGMIPLSSALDIVETAKLGGHEVGVVAAVHFELGSRLELQWLRHQVAALQVSNNWHHLAKSGLRHELHKQQRKLTAQVLAFSVSGQRTKEIVDHWAAAHGAVLDRYRHIINDIKASGAQDFAMLSVAVNEVRSLLAASQGVAA